MKIVSMNMLVLCFTVLAASAAFSHGGSIAEDPESVQDWFTKLPYAKQETTKLHFYIHDILSGKNATSFRVAQSNITATSPTLFGATFVIDDILTLGPDPGSQIIGRAQGIYAFSSLEEPSISLTLNFVFAEGKYNGSSLSVIGTDAFLSKYRESSIVGGTGVFRLARGIATAQTYFANPTTLDAVVEYNLVVIHY